MGGHKKKGQAQRTKNNAQPSNSGRIADLVESKNFQFSSFSTLSESSFASTSSQNAPLFSHDMFGSNVDPNFQVVLKKMNKKDATTRFKALQELKELSKSCSPDVLKQVLPIWARIYCLLAVDVEHKVREAVQDVHRLIVNSVGRNLAPYLKQIAPLWFVSQYDTYAPAASVATNSFQEAFSLNKYVEVIVFCQAEILGYIKENLLNLTLQSVSKGDLSKEEMEAKYEKIVISSLNGYTLYLSKIPSEQMEKFITINQEIVSSNKFWKFSKSKSTTVRSSWFKLITSLCQYSPFLLESEKKQLANSVIGGIEEYDCNVWVAALHSTTIIKDFWENVNVEKFFFPKLCSMLRHGGKGNATNIFPNILLLLSTIPPEMIKDKQQFYDKMFNSYQEGMKFSLVIQSPQESHAVASSFVECIHYLVKENTDDHTFCQFLLKEHIIKVLSMYMLQTAYRNQIKSFVRTLKVMLKFWCKNEGKQELYVILLKKFWEEITFMSVANLENSMLDKEQLSAVLINQVHIVEMFIFNVHCESFKKNMQVSFADDTKVKDLIVENDNIQVKYEKTDSEKMLEKFVLMYVAEMFQSYYTFCLEKVNKPLQISMLSQMNKIIKLLGSNIDSIISSLEPKWTFSVLTWLKNEELPMEHLLDIVFTPLQCLDQNEYSELMAALTGDRCKECLKDALQLASSSDNDQLQKWLQSDDLKSEICKAYEVNNEKSISRILEMSKHFFNLNSKGEFIIGISTVLCILNKIEVQLSSHNENDLILGTEMLNALINSVSSFKDNRFEDISLKVAETLFVNIIKGQGNTVYKTWKKCLMYISTIKISENSLNNHLKKIIDHISTLMYDGECIFDVKLIHRAIIRMVVTLTNDTRTLEEFVLQFIKRLLSSVRTSSSQDCIKQVEIVCSYGDIITGKLFAHVCLPESEELKEMDKNWDPLKKVNVLSIAKSLDFVVKILSCAFGVEICEDDIEDDSLLSIPNLSIAVKNTFDEYIVHLIYGLTLIEKFKKYYSSTRQYYAIKNYIEPLRSSLKELVHRCDKNQQRRIYEEFISARFISSVLQTEAKELLHEFLEGTLQEVTNDTVDEDCLNLAEKVLEIHDVQELRKLVETKSVSATNLNDKIKIISDKYKELFKTSDDTYENISPNFYLMTAEVAWLFQAIIANYSTSIEMTGWDFARISVTKWLKSISKIENYSDHYIEFVTMTIAASKLLVTISKILSDDESLSHYCEEWKDLFAGDAYYFLCKSWKNLTESAITSGVNYMNFLHVVQVSETIGYLCDMKSFHKIKPEDDGVDIKEWIDFTMVCILTPSVPVQLTSYKVIIVLLPNITKLDEDLNESSLSKISCNMFEPKLIETQTVFMAMLQDFSLGISCSVAPFTDSYTYTLAYFLLWSVIIQMCNEGDTQQKYIYPLWIKEKNIINPFIKGVVKLMPEPVVHFQETNTKKKQEFFISSPSLTFFDWTSEKLSHLSCWLLTELMAALPAVIRQWASEAEHKQLAFVDRLVTAFISPYLASREMIAINKQQKSFDNMKVYTYPSVREVIAVYSVEESSTELVVQLANNHPLSHPKVDISKAMISSIQTRQWLKQLTIFLTHQNGSIWDGLVLWKNNLDKKFEGIDECYICYSVIHNTTHQLPKLSCHTCKKKFHSYCLYKWFSTSNKSTCPICRAIF